MTRSDNPVLDKMQSARTNEKVLTWIFICGIHLGMLMVIFSPYVLIKIFKLWKEKR